ncbi:uncharacterized protein LOC129742169 isoform X2 [Uranotaenia lowii]|uniref:uncharacterized protein LOC129742169 isoform X2 n=1 Tax=Uranotaenia lowii TaxID=190385 RepID=UPI00247A207D|nr:uncharacterized protein LOC129742169 isoform X2 [Uranotaenia lowii]
MFEQPASYDIDDEIDMWGYPISIYGYEKSLLSEDSNNSMSEIIVAGRGRGMCNNDMDTIRMASEINKLKTSNVPIGHLRTTTECLDSQPENEITPLLRKLGISGHDGTLSSKTMYRIPDNFQDLYLDRNVPLILNEELFRNQRDSHPDDLALEPYDPYDPSRPLHEQFTTIKEFAPKTAEIPKSVSSVDSFDLSTNSAPANDSDPTSDAVSTDSSVDMSWANDTIQQSRSLLPRKCSISFTPRQLYELKKLYAYKFHPKDLTVSDSN